LAHIHTFDEAEIIDETGEVLTPTRAAARLRYIAGTAWSAKCYMNMRPLYQPHVFQTEAAA
jgi:hypothetical protein